jgi:hypothetical protein
MAAKLGHIVTEETRNKISKANLGKKKTYTPEMYKQICDSRKGRTPWNKGKHNIYPKEMIQAMRDRYSGSKSRTWKGGVTPLHSLIRKMSEYKKWKITILGRRHCQKCSEKCYYAHHIYSFKDLLQDFLREYSQFSPIEDKETLSRLAITYKPFWNLNNGMALCKKCHTEAHLKKEIQCLKT